jgi:hypothetical protein
MLHADDGDRPEDVALGDHARRLIDRHPADFGGLVSFGLSDLFGSVR